MKITLSSLLRSAVQRPDIVSVRLPAVLCFGPLAAIMLLLAVPAFPANGRDAVDLGVIGSTGRVSLVLAVPRFRPKTRNDAQVAAGTFQDTIYRNATASGVFKRPQNVGALESVFEKWHAGGRRDFGGFGSAGAEILCVGEYAVAANGELTADVYAFDVASGSRIFGNRYTRSSTADAPKMARQIADDLLRYIGHEDGIANSLIAYISTQSGGKEVWVMQSDGSNPTRITTENALVTTPAFGARGGEIYFTSYRRYNPDLYGILVDRSNAWVVSQYPGSNMSPAWSETAGRMAMVLMKDGNSEIYTADRGGRGLARVTRHRAIDASPTWSPDGRRIAFVSNRTGSPQIYVMNADGSATSRLTFQGNYNTEPAWSPDGASIAYVSRVGGGRHHIFAIDLGSAAVRQLTRGNHNNEDPTWAPNGQYLAFASTRSGGRSQIFRMRADGSNVVQLTNQGVNSSPSWGPSYE